MVLTVFGTVNAVCFRLDFLAHFNQMLEGLGIFHQKSVVYHSLIINS